MSHLIDKQLAALKREREVLRSQNAGTTVVDKRIAAVEGRQVPAPVEAKAEHTTKQTRSRKR
jgi:hypothetical protein